MDVRTQNRAGQKAVQKNESGFAPWQRFRNAFPGFGKTRKTLARGSAATGRTHQIRVHLAESGLPVVGDKLYGREDARLELGLRAVRLAYTDPFTRRRVEIRAPVEPFCREYGFDPPKL